MAKRLVIFTYADAGLGHLRVTGALYAGLPKREKSAFLGTDDSATSFLHRFTSTNPFFRRIAEAMQYGFAERVLTRGYKTSLKRGESKIRAHLASIMMEQQVKPDELLFVCTHFGLAHQIASICSWIKQEFKVKVRLAVVVTDDSPQRAWMVRGADVTFVPSRETKAKMQKLAKNKINIKVNSYPVSPNLNVARSVSQIEPSFIAPVSGAAVGLGYSKSLIINIQKLIHNARFSIISRDSPHTHEYLRYFKSKKHTRVFAYDIDQLVVEHYDRELVRMEPRFEITKPSEQCFKALFPASKVGGVILLLTNPVGRQEYDNIDFLTRNGLMPDMETGKRLQQNFEKGICEPKIARLAREWRAVNIPRDPYVAAEFIKWGLDCGLFASMTKARGGDATGVKTIWDSLLASRK